MSSFAVRVDASCVRWLPYAAALLLTSTFLLTTESSFAADATKEQLDFFESKIRPLLVAKCQKCHGDNMQKGGLRMDSLTALKNGGESGPAVIPGEPAKSLLIEAVQYKTMEMPPDGKLSPENIDLLVTWVKMGAPWPKETEPDLTVRGRNRQITDEDRQWWSFQPIVRPQIPVVAGDNFSRNPIDQFVVARLRQEGIQPSARAPLPVLARRVKMDLTGLPLTPTELDLLASEQAEDLYERMVDHWLQSPRFGENWARHWLDIVRYAESDGYRQDAFRKSAWRYRDYVIRSFNQDKPYSRFVREQLAGDEIVPHSADAVIATGFLRAGIYEYNQRDVRAQWDSIINEMTDVTADVFLGLSMGCARCHDHKYDPFLKDDYFRLRSVFTPVVLRDELPAVSAAEYAAYQDRMSAWEAKTAEFRAVIDSIETVEREKASRSPIDKFPDDIREVFAKPESFRSPYEQQIVKLAWRQVEEELDKLDFTKILKGETKERWLTAKKELDQHLAEMPQPLPTALGVTDIGPTAPPTVLPPKNLEEEYAPTAPVVLNQHAFDGSPAAAQLGTTGRRTAFANWLTSRENPLTARVIVNRVWQFHYGRGLAPTPSDLGRLGTAPTHPELLDWLAVELIDSGWSLKHIHRLIVTSSTYQQASHGDGVADSFAKDTSNQWFSRYPIRRLSAEQIRDAALMATNELNLNAGGAGVEANVPRRTIYTKVMRNKTDPLLDEFDAPDNVLTTPVRSSTVTPNQSLLLINGAWGLARAKALAANIGSKKAADEQLEGAYLRVLGRVPTAAEKEVALKFLYESSSERGKPNNLQERIVDLCHVLFNSNEFLYID